MRTVLETKQLTDDLLQVIEISHNEESIFLRVNYKQDRFVIEKTFKNSHLGVAKLEEFSKQLNSEDKVEDYLNLTNGME